MLDVLGGWLRLVALAVALVAMFVAVAITWRGRDQTEGDEPETEDDQELRIPALQEMPVKLYYRGEKVTVPLAYVSLTGMGLRWEGPPVGSGTTAKLFIEGYLVLPASVIGAQDGIMRLRYHSDVTPHDRQRLINDCVAGIWNTPEVETAAPAPLPSHGDVNA